MNKLEGRPTALKLGTSNFRPFKMPSLSDKRPQTFFNEKRMGQKRLGAGSFSAKELPLSLSIGAGSAGAIIFGYNLGESQWKGILIGAGLMGLGYSIYNLFSGSDAPSAGEQSPADSHRIPTQNAFDKLVGSFKSPRMYEEVDQPGPDWLLTANYFDIDVEFVLTNPSDESVTTTLRFMQTESATRSMYPNSAGNTATYFKTVTVPAKSSVTVTFQIDTLNWTGALTERLVAEKIRSGDPQDRAVKLSEVTFFV